MSAGHVVEVVFGDRQVQRADVERCAFGQPAAQQAVGLLVGSPLPRAVGVAEMDVDAERGFDVGPAGKFAILVSGEGAHQPGGLAAQRSGDRFGDLRGAIAVGQRHHQGVPPGALHQGRSGACVGGTDDQVAFPVAGLGSAFGRSRPFADRPVIVQRAWPLGMTAARLAAVLPRQVSPRVVAEPAAAVRGRTDRRPVAADRLRDLSDIGSCCGVRLDPSALSRGQPSCRTGYLHW